MRKRKFPLEVNAIARSVVYLQLCVSQIRVCKWLRNKMVITIFYVAIRYTLTRLYQKRQSFRMHFTLLPKLLYPGQLCFTRRQLHPFLTASKEFFIAKGRSLLSCVGKTSSSSFLLSSLDLSCDRQYTANNRNMSQNGNDLYLLLLLINS